MTPVSEIADWRFAVGEITKTLMEDYRAAVQPVAKDGGGGVRPRVEPAGGDSRQAGSIG